MKLAEPVDALRTAQGPCFATLFGRFQLRGADGSDIVISNRRARMLLAMLCLARDEVFDRDFLSRLLWPGRFEAHAKASLRQCLLDLGKLLAPCGNDMLEVTRSSVVLRSGSITSDLGALEESFARGDYAAGAAQLAAIGNKRILDQMELGDAFDHWLEQHRAEAEARLRAAVEAAIANLLRDGKAAEHAQLVAAWSLRSPAASVAQAPAGHAGKVRIAVLPFETIGEQGEQDEPGYFAEGMVDELITALGQVPQLLVSGRTSSFHFRGSAQSPSQIAAELGVSHLIEGAVQRQGERVRIRAHLIAGDSGFELWADRFDGTMGDVFAFQERVAQAITAAIGQALDMTMQAPQVRGMTHSREAYDLYLQGQSLCARLFGEGVLDAAVVLFEQALALDPDFAECWVALAEAHQLVSVYTQCLDRLGECQKMADCAQRAIDLSPRLAYPYALLGLYEITRFNFVGALDYAYQANRLEPNNPAVTMRLASFLIFIGRTRDAMPLIRAALEQDPADGRKYALLCGAQFCLGELEAANQSGLRMVALGMPSTLLAVTTAALGNRDLAIAQYLQTQQMVNSIILPPVGIGIQTPEAMDAYWQLAAKAICGGSLEERQTYWQVLEMLFAVLHDKADLAISGPSVLTGNPDLVFRTFGHCISPSNLIGMVPLWAGIEPICQIWQHGEFIPFARRIGMAAAWDKYGWPDRLPPPGNTAAD
ncbi:tetratricopeptide repeat protein [Novosphingobium aquiterrae]|uniref:Tetratricopeptide repeat protein n=1 Tax=Novosphingobium aquiterrae TaxID=624388 RepID=A0ABV6PFB3_9SPHN